MSEAVIELNDARWEQIHLLTAGAMSPCYQCGTCTATCPILQQLGRPYSVRSIIRRAQLGQDGALDDIWLCVACAQCEARCPRQVPIVETIMGLRALAFTERKVPAEMYDLLWSVLEDGNPWEGTRSKRARWADGLDLKNAAAGVKVLLYAGCAISYDAKLQRLARNMAAILTRAGVDFGILGEREKCCGDAVRVTGERGYLKRLIESNIKDFQQTEAEAIVALSPHCFDIFRNLYPTYGLETKVLHYTEYLEHLLDEGELPLPALPEGTAVAYHDPCYLGRGNGVFEAPRRLLQAVPGLKLTELRDNRANALCCGGGGGGMWLEPGGERLSDKRFAQAKEADVSILATACPYCVQNFHDSARRMGGPRVMDVLEILTNGGDQP